MYCSDKECNVFICDYSFAIIHLRLFICDYSFAIIHLRVFICDYLDIRCIPLTPVLTAHFNSAMAESTFLSILKIGKITPIFKKDDEQLLENYRPISTLPIFGKIFEKLIYSRLYGFFASNGILNKNQFGFRQGHSTSHALNYSINHIQSL